MFRTIAVIAAVAAAAIAASPYARAQSVSYGGTHYAGAGGPSGPYTTNPGPYGGYAPTPTSYGPYGAGGFATRDVSYSYGSYYGNDYGGGPYSGPFRTDSFPQSGTGR